MPTTDAPTRPASDGNGFSSRWMLDGRAREGATPVAGNAQASAHPVDTDGDGVADTLSVRVDAAQPSRANRLAAWLGRSIVTVLVVAALVVAGAAVTALYHTRTELERTAALLAEDRAALADARADADGAADRIAALQREASSTAATTTELEAERDELQLEVDVLRGMLLDEDRRGGTSR